MNYKVQEAVWADLEQSMIDCTIMHQEHGRIPTTVMIDGDDRPDLVEEVLQHNIKKFSPRVASPQEVAQEVAYLAKANKVRMVKESFVEVNSNLYHADTESINDMCSAVVFSEGPSIEWKMATGDIELVPLTDLIQAGRLAVERRTKIITT